MKAVAKVIECGIVGTSSVMAIGTQNLVRHLALSVSRIRSYAWIGHRLVDWLTAVSRQSRLLELPDKERDHDEERKRESPARETEGRKDNKKEGYHRPHSHEVCENVVRLPDVIADTRHSHA